MTSRLVAVVVDCADADALARFWAAALGHHSIRAWDDDHGTTYAQIDDAVPLLLFQPVDEPRTRKNRLHLDVAPQPGGTQRGEVRRLTALGATVLDEAPGLPWIVMADPEGNEFCVLPAED
ncbi:VOC family protein [Pseudonocardia sp.]|jgi:catechol 2,3-dioxygenase-like lactoylglutathione lyase family enzyme|uniref:VOC family protein n=1 Tax=Pseudonocardia sp. TaxID=60912 RepID=UPI0031FCBCAB